MIKPKQSSKTSFPVCKYFGKNNQCKNPFKNDILSDTDKRKLYSDLLSIRNPGDVLHDCSMCCAQCIFATKNAPEGLYCEQMFFDCPLYIIAEEFYKRKLKCNTNNGK